MSIAHKKHAKLLCILPAAVVVSVAAFASASESTPAPGASSPTKPAKYEPPVGTTYHGVCLPGYWRAEEFAANLAQYRAAVGDHPPLVLHSWFAHCQELAKWRTWHWMNQTPDGGRCAGPAQSYAETSRKHGLVPVIAWTWMEYPDQGHSPRLQDLIAGQYDWYLDDWIKGLKEFHDPVFIRLSHVKALCWFQWGKQWNVERDAGQLAEYQRRLQAARYSVPFAGTKP